MFYSPILPGDRIKYRVQLLGVYNSKIANFVGEAYVGGAMKCEVRFSVAIMDKDEMKQKFVHSVAKYPVTNVEPALKTGQKLYSLPPLKVAHWTARVPIIQGGMAVRVSLHNLAGNVAKNGGVGIVAASGMKDPEELKSEIRQAREIAGTDGVIGINIMGVVGRFQQLVQAAIDEKVDLIIQGAGFRKDIFEMARPSNTPIFSLASSAKVAQKAQEHGAAAIIVVGADAAGHLGFPHGIPFRKTIDILKDVVASGINVPLIAAGGIFTGADIVEMMRAGASGVQMEPALFPPKNAMPISNSKKRISMPKRKTVVIIHSPVGLPGRAIRTPFVEKVVAGTAPKAQSRRMQGMHRAGLRQKLLYFKGAGERAQRRFGQRHWFLPAPMCGA